MHRASGTILNKKYILTVAHIVMYEKYYTFKPEEFTVLFGHDNPCIIKSSQVKKSVSTTVPYL